MPHYQPSEVRASLTDGLLCFPVTHSTDDFRIDLKAFVAHLERLSKYRPAAMIVAGGTGEFSALTASEVSQLTQAAVDTVDGELPVISPVGYGTATAIEMARNADQNGADGIFLLPPYLNAPTATSLFEHVKRICDATPLPVIVYHRGNARYSVETVTRLTEACANFIGFKDGLGDIELLTTLHTRLGNRLVYIGGIPTAEMLAPAYFASGVSTYSSAIFNFAPEWALKFYDDVKGGSTDAVTQALSKFVIPYVKIRQVDPDYAVSIVKAGMRLMGMPAGPVRPPLRDLTEPELGRLKSVLDGLA